MFHEEIEPIPIEDGFDIGGRVSAPLEYSFKQMNILNRVHFFRGLLRAISTVKIGADCRMANVSGQLADMVNVVRGRLDGDLLATAPAPHPSGKKHPGVQSHADNCASVDELRDAQVHPERHRDPQVRICGLSAYFVTLHRGVQDEIINRTRMAV